MSLYSMWARGPLETQRMEMGQNFPVKRKIKKEYGERKVRGKEQNSAVGKGSGHCYTLLSRITSLLKAFIDLALTELKVHILFAFSLLILLKYDSSKRNRKPKVTFTELCASIRNINLGAISTVGCSTAQQAFMWRNPWQSSAHLQAQNQI